MRVVEWVENGNGGGDDTVTFIQNVVKSCYSIGVVSQMKLDCVVFGCGNL